MEEMMAAIDSVTTPEVRIWLNWMMGIFLFSIVFVWKHVPARFVLGSLFLIAPLAQTIFNMTKSPILVGLAHVIVWGPLAIYLIKKEIIGKNFKLDSPYRIWLALLLATIAISLFFDIRDAILIALDMKAMV